MKLDKSDQEFRNPKVFYPDPKNIDLDRVLINLFLLLRCHGTRPARARVKRDFEKVEPYFDGLARSAGVEGFAEHDWIAQKWLESDVFDLVNRGSGNESIASLRPLHLDAHKIRIAKHCRDYNHADALYAMLKYGDSLAIDDLRRYLERGRDPATGKYDGRTELDLETLTVLKLVEDQPNLHQGPENVARFPPLCIGQSRVLCDDVERLLAYRDVVPRSVLIEYLRTILGLHLGLFVLRMARQLAGWVQDSEVNPACSACAVYGHAPEPFEACPYPLAFTTDMADDFRSRMAQMAQEDAAGEYNGRLAELVRSVFTINQLLRYVRNNPDLHVPEVPAGAVSVLKMQTERFHSDFRSWLTRIKESQEEDMELKPEIQAILDANLMPFDTFIELVTHERQKHHLKYLVQMLDKLFQKNGEFGALAQGRSRTNPRRWHLGGRLLEVLVQIAVLRVEGRADERRFCSEPILVDDFLAWMERRYGFVIGPGIGPAARKPVTVHEHDAFRRNVRALKDRLREIGFYDDLSDAYNAQTIRPRYPIGREGNS